MERLLGMRFWLLVFLPYLASAFTFLHDVLVKLTNVSFLPAWMAGPVRENGLQLIFLALIWIAAQKPVWRFVWRLPVVGPWLSRKVFPDINGVWDVELVTNWPRIEAMANAARDASTPRYDVAHPNSVPLAAPIKMVATIDQGWTNVTMSIESTGPDAKILRSRSVAFDLLRRADGVAQIAYVFDQENDALKLADGDPDRFLGAALLEISDDAQKMRGKYFTARDWSSGRNTAGEICFMKRAS